MSFVARLKTPISYYGGKQTLLRHLIPLVPDHNVYTEAFAGGAALFYAKDPAEIEVINDINCNLVNFYRVLRDDYEGLKKRIERTLHSRSAHLFAGIVYDYPEFFPSLERAWAVWVLSQQSFAARLDGTWGYDKTKNSVPKKIDNARESFTRELSDRLRRTQIECTDGLRIIRTRDTPGTFHFVDPPYVGTECGHYEGYNLMDFENLLSLLSQLKGKFMLTMFPNEILAEYVQKNAWHVVEVERTISASKDKRRKQKELIVTNYKKSGQDSQQPHYDKSHRVI